MEEYVPRDFTLKELLNLRLYKAKETFNGFNVYNIENSRYELHQFVNSRLSGWKYVFTNTHIKYMCYYSGLKWNTPELVIVTDNDKKIWHYRYVIE